MFCAGIAAESGKKFTKLLEFLNKDGGNRKKKESVTKKKYKEAGELFLFLKVGKAYRIILTGFEGQRITVD